MGLLDNFKRYVRGEDYDSDEYDEFSQEPEENSSSRWGSSSAAASAPAAPAKSDYYTPSSTRDTSSSYRSSAATQSGKVVNIHTVTQLSVVLVKPDKYENVSDVADHLKDKRTVVLNLEETNRDVARRLLDFLSGVVYATDGKIKKIANSTYIITPHNIAIQGDIVEELENNGLYI